MKNKQIVLSKEFKSQVIRAILALLIFILVYLLLLFATIAITAACIAGGLALIALKPAIFTILLGIGLASLGVLTLIFLVKFMFTSNKTDLSHMVEILEHQQPELFKMIREIVNEVGTHFPKKVYITAEVNATVFYDSSFWSMFFPIRKNLQIGLGLINVVTREELKAILSHEFGHFSQRSMKVGSYVYHVNQIIYNVLFDNASYDRMIERWASLSSYFSIFVALANTINQGIKWILRKLYLVVNKSYLALSREMEFHADAVAASITGYKPLQESLLRLSMADQAYQGVLNFYQQRIHENVTCSNLFTNQHTLLQVMAEENKIPFNNGIPQISLEIQQRFNTSKLVIEDQWASHPSVEQRIDRLKQSSTLVEVTNDVPANTLLKDLSKYQQRLTKIVFGSVSYDGEPRFLEEELFLTLFKEENAANSFPDLYKGYYDQKNITRFDLDKVNDADLSVTAFTLYSEEALATLFSYQALIRDQETLSEMMMGNLQVKSFDYDGLRYQANEVLPLISSLQNQQEQLSEKIKKHDITVYAFFKKQEELKSGNQLLRQYYEQLFLLGEELEIKFNQINTLLQKLQFISVDTPFDVIRSNFKEIKEDEAQIRSELQELKGDELIASEIHVELAGLIDKYIQEQREYFVNNVYLEDNLNLFYGAINAYSYLLNRKYFLQKKSLLTYQAGLVN
ncbi:MAG: M48 family metalloprotease [Cytophagaceae bacterium]|jgi:Zn-dependent protease with chaperone function|nr:M48 family metalloprotease [Cytophagaceae bacterium]